MKVYSTNEAAKPVGIRSAALSKYIKGGRVPNSDSADWQSKASFMGGKKIKNLRQLLPEIANGRKTRYKKEQSAAGTQQSAKTKPRRKPQPRAAMPHKKSKSKPKQ